MLKTKKKKKLNPQSKVVTALVIVCESYKKQTLIYEFNSVEQFKSGQCMKFNLCSQVLWLTACIGTIKSSCFVIHQYSFGE
jgi:hypothetical protein